MVKVVNPALASPSSLTVGNTLKTESKRPSSVKVSQGVLAQWEGTDDPSVDMEHLGKDGKISWMCNVPAQEKVDITLQWEVSTPAKAVVVGL